MKLNDDGKTVRGMDVLFPKIGEITVAPSVKLTTTSSYSVHRR